MRIEYGTSSSSLTKTAYFTDGGLTAPTGTYSVNVASLEANTTYYYRAVIQFGTKDYYGEVKSFKTSAAQSVTTTGWLELPAGSAGSNQYRGAFGSGKSRNYSYLYDKTKYASLWSAYPLTSNDITGSGSTTTWQFNPQLAESAQVHIVDNSYGTAYGNDLYSRGHQVPAADRKSSNTAREKTYYATNQTPQIQNKFNGSTWGSLETAIRNLLSSTDTIYVVTGPVYQKVGGSETVKTLTAAKSGVTPSSLPIPNYYWKAMLKVKRDTNGTVTSACAIGFWFEHKEYDDTNKDYANYNVSVDQIEKWTGFDLFANLPDSIEATVETNSSWDEFKKF